MSSTKIIKCILVVVISVGFSLFGLYEFTQYPGGYFLGDYWVYVDATKGNVSQFFYPYWFLIVIELICHLPKFLVFLLWSFINLIGIYAGLRMFGGKWWPMFFSFQVFYVLWVGQVVGIIIGGLTLLSWSLEHKKPYLAGVGLLLTLTKPQMGLPLAIGIILLAKCSWIDRIKTAIVPVIVFALSLLIYPGWPFQLLDVVRTTPPNNLGSISVWDSTGPSILLLWFPIFFLPMGVRDRLLLIACTQAITLPYFQQTDLVLLYMFPIGWLPLIGNLGFAFFQYGWLVVKFLVIIPVLIYLFITIKSLWLFLLSNIDRIRFPAKWLLPMGIRSAVSPVEIDPDK
jgi:hypothetical protein